jgi:hypothetical protein
MMFKSAQGQLPTLPQGSVEMDKKKHTESTLPVFLRSIPISIDLHSIPLVT